MADETGTQGAPGAGEGLPPNSNTETDPIASDVEAAFDAVTAADALNQSDEGNDLPPDDTPPAPTGQEQGQQGQQGQQPPADPNAPPQEYQAPHHWDVQSQEMFRKQPREVQEYLLQRDHAMTADYTRKTQEIAPLRKVAQEWAGYIHQNGDTPDHFFHNLATTERTLRTGTNEQKVAALVEIAESFGVDFSQFLEPEHPAGIDPSQDPLGVGSVIEQAIAPYKEQVQQLTAHQQQQQAAAQQAAAAQAQQQAAVLSQQIEAYRNHRDDQGNLSFPYFTEVESEMAVLAQAKVASGHPVDIAELYEQACWINPGVRAKVQAAYQHAANQQQAAEIQQRQAASGGLAGGGGGDSQPDSLEEIVGAAYDAVTA